jgi:hypothetical protein
MFLSSGANTGVARERMKAEYGKNLYSHDAMGATDVGGARHTNTFKSNIAFNNGGDHPASLEFKAK